MARRIVAIQHGDYRESARIHAAGGSEPYFGMHYTHDILDGFFRDDPHLVICLNAPPFHERHGPGEWTSVVAPQLPRRVPGRVAESIQAFQINRLIRRFRPTHVLLRTGLPIVSRAILRLCRRRNYDTMVVLANVMASGTPALLKHHQPTIRLLNEPFVFRVGNHKRPATQSLVENGLNPAKAVAWDWPGQRLAADFPPKELPAPPFELVYVGSIVQPKGVGDLIDAAKILHADGLDFRLTLIGSGAEQALLEERAQALPGGIVRFAGRLPNDEVFEAMRRATLICVPSRHEFQEGMPLTLTEALASRTPIIASDHPVIARAFVDGEGLRFFRGADPAALAAVVREVLDDPAAYRHLSATTAEALDRVNCPTTFGDLIAEWERSPLATRHGAS